MAKSGKNTLLGSGIVVKQKKVAPAKPSKTGWPKRLYHPDTGLTGKVFKTLSEQDEAKKEGWVENPAMFDKKKE